MLCKHFYAFVLSFVVLERQTEWQELLLGFAWADSAKLFCFQKQKTLCSKKQLPSISAYATRNVGIKDPDMSPEQMRHDQKQRQQEMQHSSNIDLKFFMEENNEEAFYATLDDQDSINSENLTNFPKPPCKNDEVSRK